MKKQFGVVISLLSVGIILNACFRSKGEKASVWNGKPVTLEHWANTSEAVGNIAFAADGQPVFSNHPFFHPNIKVMKYDTVSKSATPFPNKDWNTARTTDQNYFGSVLGVRNDSKGIVWVLDMGIWNKVEAKIVGWNTKTNSLERIYPLPAPVTLSISQHNDMVIDEKHNVFIIADEGIANGGDGSKAALVIVDRKTGEARRVLQGHRTTVPENTPTTIEEQVLSVNGKPLLVGADGITADENDEWLYYGPLNGSKVYRVHISDLINKALTPGELNDKIEEYSSKPNNGGFSIDKDGNLYFTEVETHSVGVVLAKDRTVHHYVSDRALIWPDGVSYNEADGYMYVSAAQLPLGAAFNNGKDYTTKPFSIFRFRPIAPGVPTR